MNTPTRPVSLRRVARFALWAMLAMAVLLVPVLWTVSASPSGPLLAQAYFPAINQNPTPTPTLAPVPCDSAETLGNGSFDNDQWFTDGRTNQQPACWFYYAYAIDEVLPFPRRNTGTTEQVQSGGVGENVHKYAWQLPDDEQLGQPRGLILNGQLVYKAFGFGIPFALQLGQSLAGIPGQTIEVTGYILGETHCTPWEDDHFIARVQLGDSTDTRWYVAMKDRRDVAGNTRAWNKFVVSAVVPASGRLDMRVIVQNNWQCATDFFFDDFSARVLP